MSSNVVVHAMVASQPGAQAVIIGRFQVPELTEGHRYIIKTAMAIFPDYPPIVLLGMSRSRMTKRNPLPFESRAQLIRNEFPTAIIAPLADQRNNDDWSDTVDTTVSLIAMGKPVLCGSRDSFMPSYKGRLKLQEISEYVSPTNGTIIRQAVGQACVDDKKFRAGVIYATQNQFHRIDSTVDAIIVHHDFTKVLVGWKNKHKRPGEAVFPGGYIDKNERAEAALPREVFEETSLSLEGKGVMLGTFVVNDWRYQRESDRNILTHVFLVMGSYTGGARPSDDLLAVEWVPIGDLPSQLVSHHLELWKEFETGIKVLVNAAKPKIDTGT